jgi:hypothetical protein
MNMPHGWRLQCTLLPLVVRSLKRRLASKARCLKSRASDSHGDTSDPYLALGLSAVIAWSGPGQVQ